MSIAVVVPVRNRARLIVEALESVLAQTRPPDRLIVVDDASTDGSAAAVERWIERRAPAFPTELVQRTECGGAGATRNAGVARAAGCELIAFLDSDDLWYPRFLEYVAAALMADPRAVAAAADRRCLDASTGTESVQRMDRFTSRTTRQLLRYGPTGTSNTIVRAADFRAVGGFDPEVVCGEDTLLMLKLSLRGKWLHVPGVHTVYRYRVADQVQEESSLSSRVDHYAYLTPLLERFFEEQGGRRAVPDSVWKREISRRWCAAGANQESRGDCDRARSSYRKAVARWSCNPRARLALWRLACTAPFSAVARKSR